jgi:hypothetical protein
MKRKKKEIPLVILEAIAPFVKSLDHRYKIIDSESALIRFEDNDIDSDFYFEITKFEYGNGKTVVSIEYKPQNKNTTIKGNVRVDHTQITDYLKKWIDTLNDYNNLETIFDDPIVKKNTERFIEQFEILDEDADIVSFDIPQLLYLEEYLESSIDKIKILKKGKSTEDIDLLADLEEEAINIKKSLTRETKKQIIKRLARFWGNAQKVGLDIIKEILINVITDVTKKLISGQ